MSDHQQDGRLTDLGVPVPDDTTGDAPGGKRPGEPHTGDRLPDEERAEINVSIAKLGPGYPLLTDVPSDWGRERNAKCLVRGHSFEHEDEDYIREDAPGDACERCGYVWR